MPTSLVFIALLALPSGLALPAYTSVTPEAGVHLAFAAGIMPLILAAIGYFVPVLTRSRDAPRAMRALPWVALASGALAFAWFLHPADSPQGYAWAAALAGGTAVALAIWIIRRGRSALGSPHPCLHWYLAAVLCLVLGLAAVLAMPLLPDQYIALKRLHLHLNVGGFVGLTALGTLHVLMPTVASRVDPSVAARLRQDLPYAVGAVLLVAIGSGWQNSLAVAGVALWAIPLTRIALVWDSQYGKQIFAWHGAAPSLAAAFVGFCVLTAQGALHGISPGQPAGSGFAFIALFLLPLVTGAAAHLLPVWLRPGPQGSWHLAFRDTTGRWGGVRALLFLCGGIGLSLGYREGAIVSILALGIFMVQAASGCARR
jgi:hypothetical protein